MKMHSERWFCLLKGMSGVLSISLLLPGGEALAQEANKTRMRVGINGGTASIPWSTHTSAFTSATTALKTDSGADDVACNLTLEGYSYWWYGGAPTVIDNDVEYLQNRDNSSNAFYNIVDEINWCQDFGVFGGCGFPINGRKPFIVTRAKATSAERGNVIAHEFGHVVGMNHDSTGVSQIMAPGDLGTSNTRLSLSSDCSTKFRSYFPVLGCPADPANGTAPAICSEPIIIPSAMAMAVEASRARPEVYEEIDFSSVAISQLLTPMVDRVPVEAEDYYGEKDLAVLRGVLSNPNESEKHRMAAALIGLISGGSEEDVQLLLDYLRTPGANVAATMMALGYIVNRKGNERALTALADRFLDGSNAKQAAMGLALTGDPRARDLLADAALRATDWKAKWVLNQQVSANTRIEQFGLRAYYLDSLEHQFPEVPDLGQGPSGPLPMND